MSVRWGCDPACRGRERLREFCIAVNCEWAQLGACVGVAELPMKRAHLQANFLHTGSPFLSRDQQAKTSILTSHILSNAGGGVF